MLLSMLSLRRKKNTARYDDADKSFVFGILDVLGLAHGDAVLEISSESVLSCDYFAEKFGAYVQRISKKDDFHGGTYELSVMIDVDADVENLFALARENAEKVAVIFIKKPSETACEFFINQNPTANVASGNYEFFLF